MSAKLISRASIKYGRIEFVATLPRGDYLWPALWMLPTGAGPWPTAGEIDVMESMGNAPGDKFARDHSEFTGASKDDIDDQFGWKQAERAKDQQIGYAGPRARAHRARITMMT